MPLPNIEQPNSIPINDHLRLRRYDGSYEKMLPGYQDPYVYQNSEGIFDEAKIPNMNYVKGMCSYLDSVGEFYFIEVKEGDDFVSIGDVTIRPENPPIAIWFARYRGSGIGTLVMQTVINRLKVLGYPKISGSGIFKWNAASQHLHEKLGFVRVDETEDSFIYELKL